MQTVSDALMTILGWYLNITLVIWTVGLVVSVPVVLLTNFQPDITATGLAALTTLSGLVLIGLVGMVVETIIQLRRKW